MIEVRALSKRFGETQALDRVDLDVPAGTVLGLLGPNGAGKTTLVRTLTTLLKPDAGVALVAGHDVVRSGAQVRASIGLAGQYAAVDELLTGRENLELVGLWYHLSRDECRQRASEVLERFSLSDAADSLVKTYSGGMRRRLDIGASLIARPPVLFLDEPTTGMDPRTRNDVWEFIDELVAGGTTVLLTTQYMEEAERLADRIVVIDGGVVIATGTAAELKADLGGDTLEIRLTAAADLERAAGVLADLSAGPVRIEAANQLIRAPASGGISALIKAGQALEAQAIGIDDIGIRRPSMDDVFLALTSQTRTEGEISKGVPEPEISAVSVRKVRALASPGKLTTSDLRPTRLSLRLAVRDVAGVAKRNLLRTARTPQMLLIGAVQPAMLLVLFRYVLGGAITVPNGSYVNYVVPAVFLEAVMIGGITTAVGLAQDLQGGMIDRFRSLPMARAAVLAGRTLADIARSLLSLAIMVGLGLLVGFRFHAGPGPIAAGLALVIFFGYAFSWVYAAIGLATKDPETAQVGGVLPFFVLMFASSAVVPVSTMPSWLQGFARNQPLSVTIDAVRSLLEGQPAGHWLWQSLLWSVGLAAVFFLLSLRLYRRTAG